MMFILTYLIMIFIIPLVLFILTILFKKTKMMNREILTPFECGFDPPTKARLAFSLQFFFMGILFIIFDVEIALIIPLPLMNFLSYNFLILILMFISMLLLGLWYEMSEKTLRWPS